MKIIKNIPILTVIALCTTLILGCSETVTDFGFDGQINGLILDQSGNAVSGDATNAALTVFALGDEDRIPLELRVNPDGSFANEHLYPQSYSVWIEGPVDAPGPQTVNLTGAPMEVNITVTPFLVIAEPTASISGSILTVNYSVTPSAGHVADEIRVLVSTIPKLGNSTGSGDRWETRENDDPIVTNSGTAVVTLDATLLSVADTRGTGKLYVRVSAKSDQTSDWNYSIPITVEL